MRSLKSPVFILILHLLKGVLSNSLIQLNKNGYEGIVIAIDHDVPEDEALIQHIKDMVTQASPYLFEATGKRFYFKDVAILIPESWKTKPDYERPKLETIKNADVLVSATSPVGEDQPHTEHVGACGEKGLRIHLTPNFLAGKKLKEYGPQERAFVHEWAHLRWGVFDEYNNEEKFYQSKGKAEAVRRSNLRPVELRRGQHLCRCHKAGPADGSTHSDSCCESSRAKGKLFAQRAHLRPFSRLYILPGCDP